jgi:hypothetical protein
MTTTYTPPPAPIHRPCVGDARGGALDRATLVERATIWPVIGDDARVMMQSHAAVRSRPTRDDARREWQWLRKWGQA